MKVWLTEKNDMLEETCETLFRLNQDTAVAIGAKIS